MGDTGVAQLGIVVGGSVIMAKTDEYVINPFLDLVKTGLVEFSPSSLTGVLDGLEFKNTGVSKFILNAKGIESILDFMISKSDTDYVISPSEEVFGTTFYTYSDVLLCSKGATETNSLVKTLFTVNTIGDSAGFCNVEARIYIDGAYASTFKYLSNGGVSYDIGFYSSKYMNSIGVIGSSLAPIAFDGLFHNITAEFKVTRGSANVFVPGVTGSYPSDFSKYQSIDDYNSLHDAYTGSPSICVDWDKLLKDHDLTNLRNIDDVIGALEGVISSPGGADVLGQSISLEYDGVVVPDTPEVTDDDSNPSLLKKLMDWLFDLFKKLAELLEKLLKKMLEGLKELLLSLFVPSYSFLQENVDILKNNLEPKLPYTQFIELFNREYDGSPLKDIYINWQGQDICIVKVTLFEKFREIFNLGVYAVTFFLLAVYNYNNIYKLVRGSDYVSATNTINHISDKGSEEK